MLIIEDLFYRIDTSNISQFQEPIVSVHRSSEDRRE